MGDLERPRKRSPKVKTGCKTCKVRRIKCDEARPSCFRCTSTGRKCDGYSPIKENFQVQIWTSCQTSAPQHDVSNLNDLGDNVHHLEFYHHCAQPALSTSFDKEFWSRITLQMAHSEPAVRHALIALSYLYQTEPGDLKHARLLFATNDGRGTLLTHYNKSIGYLVKRIAEPSCPLELILVICILFVCIEFLRGNYHTGFTHLINGLKLISERQKRQQDTCLNLLDDGSSQTLSSHFRYTSKIIEEILAPIFVRSIASALMYGVSAEDAFEMPWPTPTTLKQTAFTNIREAQEACHQIRNSSLLHIRNMGVKFFEQNPINHEDLQRQKDLIECHRIWFRNLQEFEQQQKLPVEDQVISSILKISHHAAFIYVSCSTEVCQQVYDGHLNIFKQILHHARFIIQTASQALTSLHGARFTFDISVIPPLYFVATRCRCPTTRREAVSLLEMDLPREGLWDAAQEALVSRRVIEMEESEVNPETGWPVEETRLWSSVVDANMDQNGAFWVSHLLAKWLGKIEPKLLQTKLTWEQMRM